MITHVFIGTCWHTNQLTGLLTLMNVACWLEKKYFGKIKGTFRRVMEARIRHSVCWKKENKIKSSKSSITCAIFHPHLPVTVKTVLKVLFCVPWCLQYTVNKYVIIIWFFILPYDKLEELQVELQDPEIKRQTNNQNNYSARIRSVSE